MRWLRIPLMHFLVGGAVLFRLVHAGPSTPGERGTRVAPVTITAADVGLMRAAYTRETGLPATPADEVALIDRAVDEELLFREALARGLDRNDRSVRNWLIEQMRAVTEDRDANADDLYAQARALELDRKDLVVRRILVQKMRLLLSLPKPDEEPSDAELQAYYDAHRADYRQPARVSFTHVFLSADRRGDALDADAAALGARLRAEAPRPQAAVALGDHFPLSHRFEQASERHIAKLFGPEFAAGVLAIESDDWVCPVGSAYGVHCVLVTERIAPSDPPFESVRRQVLQRVRAERRDERLLAALVRLRGEYALQIDSESWRRREAT